MISRECAVWCCGAGGGEPGEEGQIGRVRVQGVRHSLSDHARPQAHLPARVAREIARPKACGVGGASAVGVEVW